MLKKVSDNIAKLFEYLDDYIVNMESINDKRLLAAKREFALVNQECIAFNLLRKNIEEVRVEEYGFPVPEDQ